MPGYRRWCGERLSNLSPQHSRFVVLLLQQTAHPNLRDNARLQHRPRYSQVFKLDRVRPSVVADGIADCQIWVPTVPIVFCETRKFAQEWTHRFLAAARVELSEELVGDLAVHGNETAPPRSPAPPTPAIKYVAGRRRTTSSSPTAAEPRRR